jgi:hypothetical protein
MMMRAAIACLFLVMNLAAPEVGFAQTAAPATKPAAAAKAAPAATPTAPASKPAMSAKSKECSDQADQQGLHGKARKAFREKCKKS